MSSLTIILKLRRTLAAMAWAALMLSATGCGGPVNVAAPSTGQPISFADDIQPIFNNRCTTCHRTGGRADNEGIALKLVAGESYALLVDQPSVQNADLTLVVPGDAAASLMFLKVSSNTPPVGATMPLIGARVSSAELGLIRDWIDQGALDN